MFETLAKVQYNFTNFATILEVQSGPDHTGKTAYWLVSTDHKIKEDGTLTGPTWTTSKKFSKVETALKNLNNFKWAN
jgi:hypothetical protein